MSEFLFSNVSWGVALVVIGLDLKLQLFDLFALGLQLLVETVSFRQELQMLLSVGYFRIQRCRVLTCCSH